MREDDAPLPLPKLPHVPERRGRLRAFVSPQVLERLNAGTFQAVRSVSMSSMTQGSSNAREETSPLALTKKSIRYQPAVFRDRASEILEIAHYLNQSYSKVLMLVGSQGSGKLSLLRGVAELLEPRYAELLWFEVPSYGDSVDFAMLMLKQLVALAQRRHPDATPSVSPAQWEAHTVSQRADLFQTLTPILNQLKATPTLIVVNGLDAFLQGRGSRLQAPAFIEVLNFLLSFDSFKMALAGENPCTEALNLSPQALKTLHLGGFKTTPDLPFTFPDETAQACEALFHLASETPWLWQALINMQKRSPRAIEALQNEWRILREAHEATLSQLSRADLLEVLAFQTQKTVDGLGGEAFSLLALLSVMRQPLSVSTLAVILQSSPDALNKALRHPVLKALIRFTVNPQAVALGMQRALEDKTASPALDPLATPLLVELYRDIQAPLRALQSVEVQRYWHHRLAHFYREQANLSSAKRLLPHTDSLALEREARFHDEQEKNLERSVAFGGSENSYFQSPSAVSAEVLRSSKGVMPLTRTEAGTTNQAAHAPVNASKPSLSPTPPQPAKSKAELKQAVKAKAGFNASFGNNAPVEAKPKLASSPPLPVLNPAKEAPPLQTDLERAYLQALMKLAHLQVHVNDVLNLPVTLENLQKLKARWQGEEDLQIRLMQVFLATQEKQIAEAWTFLEPLLVGMKTQRYSEAVLFSILLRLNELLAQEASLLEKPLVWQSLRDYFERNQTFKDWQSRKEETAQSSTPLNTPLNTPLKVSLSEERQAQLAIWAKTLSHLLKSPQIKPSEQALYLGDLARLAIELGAYTQAVKALHQLAERFLRQGGKAPVESALEVLNKAETLDKLHNHQTLKWTTQRDKALVLWELNHPKEAAQILNGILHDAQTQENRLWQATTLFTLGELAFDSVNGVEWGLSCMAKALAFGESVLGVPRYQRFLARRKQLEHERISPSPVKHLFNTPEHGSERSTERMERQRLSTPKPAP